MVLISGKLIHWDLKNKKIIYTGPENWDPEIVKFKLWFSRIFLISLRIKHLIKIK